eukprot:TRINITY_DN7588_c0_g1_i2.p1 TRINITY_DN7588_c0_g1~~TRINITY_DN7588_c0_g1_i2.p1  ORF type:complete len:237 (+),score=52.36 TRINITY_DN7588_c0_g1_i2:34-744(+)
MINQIYSFYSSDNSTCISQEEYEDWLFYNKNEFLIVNILQVILYAFLLILAFQVTFNHLHKHEKPKNWKKLFKPSILKLFLFLTNSFAFLSLIFAIASFNFSEEKTKTQSYFLQVIDSLLLNLFITAFSVLVLYWHECYLRIDDPRCKIDNIRSVPRITIIAINIIQAILWIVFTAGQKDLEWNGDEFTNWAFNGYIYFIIVISTLLALAFLVFGIRLFLKVKTRAFKKGVMVSVN